MRQNSLPLGKFRYFRGTIRYLCGKIRYLRGKIRYLYWKIRYLRGKNRYIRGRIRYIRGQISYPKAGFVTSCNDLVCVCVCMCVNHQKTIRQWTGDHLYTCVYLLEKPFASELETHTNEINVSQVSATLHTFMANAQAWYGFLAKCI